MAKNPRAVPRHNEFSTLGKRIQWLRAKQKPFMTQMQLSHISRVPIVTIKAIENDKMINMTLNTVRRIAWALNCKVFFNITTKPSRAVGLCQPVLAELPPPPKRHGKTSERDRVRAELYGRSAWKNYRRGPRRAPRKVTSEAEDSQNPFLPEPPAE